MAPEQGPEIAREAARQAALEAGLWEEALARMPRNTGCVGYTHDKMIDLIIARPRAKNSELAAVFGYSPAWVSRVINSDMFRARLEERKTELGDAVLVESIDEKYKAVVSQSLDVIMAKLEAGRSQELALATLKVAASAMGYGARNPAQQNNFVVVMPPKSASSDDWLEATRPQVRQVLEADEDLA